MFETLFIHTAVQTRHLNAPLAKSREQFLRYCAEQGYSHSMQKKIAWILLVLSQDVDLCSLKRVSVKQIEYAVDHRSCLNQRHQGIGHAASSRQMFIHIATAWFGFRKCLAESPARQSPYADYVDKFILFMRDERGLSPVTISTRERQVTNFFKAVWRPGISLHEVSVQDVDDYLALQGNQGWSRASLHSMASTLRCFFRYAEGQHWTTGIAAAIEAPRLFTWLLRNRDTPQTAWEGKMSPQFITPVGRSVSSLARTKSGALLL